MSATEDHGIGEWFFTQKQSRLQVSPSVTLAKSGRENSSNKLRLYYNYFRDYDPQMGRYIESDPIGLKAGVNPYGYATANPISQSDPLGLDITVCFFSGGSGHVGIGVNSANTTGLYPANKSAGLAMCHDTQGKIQSDQPIHNWGSSQCLSIKTSPVQDALARQFIDRSRNDRDQKYNLCSNQCTAFVRNALEFAGIPLPLDAQYTATNLWGAISQSVPSNFYSALQRAYSPSYGGSW
jgi:RHS repeat-associated protein